MPSLLLAPLRCLTPSATHALLAVVLATPGCTSDLPDEFQARAPFSQADGGADADGGTPSSDCPAGSQAEGFDCVPCAVGSYCPEGSASEHPCSSGTWDHDANPATRCEPWRNCTAGEFVQPGASATRNRSCVPCEPGSYSAAVNASECLAWAACEPGRYARVAGTATDEPVCSDCAPGEFCAGGVASVEVCTGGWDHDADPATPCAEHTRCPAGSTVSDAGDALHDRRCSECPEGTFSSDEDSASCAAFRVCEPGSYQVLAGTRTSDATCAGCPSGSYSADDGADSCTPFTECPVGEFVETPGTTTADQQCAPCPPGTLSTEPNAGACVLIGACPAGTVERTPGTDTTPPECEDCNSGEYCAGGESTASRCGDDVWDDDGDPATPCIAKTTCVAGEFVLAPGSDTDDRTCDGCPAGTFSDAEDSGGCTPWQSCAAPASYMTAAPSATADRECAPCEPPTVAPDDDATECVLLTFQMSGGTVVMEAESFHTRDSNGSMHAWELVAAAGASGGQCMDVNPDSGTTWTTPIGSSPRLDFQVDFTTTGTFYVHVRGDPGASGAGSDSVFSGVDNALAPAYDFDDQSGSWGWRQQAVEVTTEGVHTVSIWAREDGFCVDKIVISTNATPPVGNGPPESPKG